MDYGILNYPVPGLAWRVFVDAVVQVESNYGHDA